jgi:hypothetical protein
MIVEASSSSNSKASQKTAKEMAGSFLKLPTSNQEKSATSHQVTSGCPICSVYGALAKKGWLKSRGEIDYKNHLMSRHGLEA